MQGSIYIKVYITAGTVLKAVGRRWGRKSLVQIHHSCELTVAFDKLLYNWPLMQGYEAYGIGGSEIILDFNVLLQVRY